MASALGKSRKHAPSSVFWSRRPAPRRVRNAARLIMSRKKKHPEHENHERWLVSYADLLTLLFAFALALGVTASFAAGSQNVKGKSKVVSAKADDKEDAEQQGLPGPASNAVLSPPVHGRHRPPPGELMPAANSTRLKC